MSLEEFVRFDAGTFGPTNAPGPAEREQVMTRVRRLVRSHGELERLSRKPPRATWTEKERKDYDVKREQFVGMDERGNDVVSFDAKYGW